ncbi:MAG: helix-turn-helix domain-containing protein [Clostridia bacterium]|nr:helix-turn-helix domain-containing protein [Clostridia bacterium]
MNIDRKLNDIVIEAAKSIEKTICLLDETGEIIVSSAEELIGDSDENFDTTDFRNGAPCAELGNKTYALVDFEGHRPLGISVDATGKEIETYLFFIKKLVIEILKTSKKKLGREEVFRRIILDKTDVLEIQEAVSDFNIDTDCARCVIIVQTVNDEANKIYDALHTIFHMKEGDIIVGLNRYVLALVKTIDEDIDMDSLSELVNALNDTIANEIAIESHIGVGGVKSGLFNIRESFCEAQEAINLGLMQQSKSSIFMFHKLLLERFLQNIQRDTRKEFYDLAYSESLKKILNEEMLTTVLTFFENNLNLSEAARRLFIHRNTLIYRLEKIQKSTGLDLRNFDDAVLLKTVIMIGKSLSSNNRME